MNLNCLKFDTTRQIGFDIFLIKYRVMKETTTVERDDVAKKTAQLSADERFVLILLILRENENPSGVSRETMRSMVNIPIQELEDVLTSLESRRLVTMGIGSFELMTVQNGINMRSGVYADDTSIRLAVRL